MWVSSPGEDEWWLSVTSENYYELSACLWREGKMEKGRWGEITPRKKEKVRGRGGRKHQVARRKKKMGSVPYCILNGGVKGTVDNVKMKPLILARSIKENQRRGKLNDHSTTMGRPGTL